MSAFADEPDHFVKWLNRLPPEGRSARRPAARPWPASSSAARVYGQLRPGPAARHHRPPGRRARTSTSSADSATALRPGRWAGLALETEGGRTYEVDAAVLAVGNFPPGDPEPTRLRPQPLGRERPGDGIRPDLPIDRPGLRPHRRRRRPHAPRKRRLQGADPRLLPPRPAAPGARAVLALVRASGLDAGDRRSLVSLVHAGPPRGASRAAEGRRGLALHRSTRFRPHVQLLWRELSPADHAPLRAPPAALLGGPPPPHGAANRRGDRGGAARRAGSNS